MKNIHFKSILFLITVFVFQNTAAQNLEFWKDISMLAKTLEKSKYYNTELKIQMYASNQLPTPIDTKTFKISKFKDRTKIVSDYNVTYMDSKLLIVVDSIDKTITLLPPDKRFLKKMTGLIIEKADSSITKVTQNQGDSITTYVIDLKDDKLSSVDVTFNPDKYLITRIVMYYKYPLTQTYDSPDSTIEYKRPRVEITYIDTKLNKTFNSNFSSKDFVILKKNRITPNKRYSDYAVINNLH